jgi:hypothetical protein
VIFALPHLSSDLSSHDLALAAARVPDARIVAYRTYPQSFAWVLRRPIVVAAYTGELGSDGVRPPERYWSGAELWRRWRAGERLVLVARRRSLHEIADSAGTMPGAIAQNRKYVVVTNVPGTR